MNLQANIGLSRNEFFAELSDGRQLAHSDLRAFAGKLHLAGVRARDARCEWRTGQRMLTAGQKVALNAEIRRLELGEQDVQVPHARNARRGFAIAA